jgi:hypothetical protein
VTRRQEMDLLIIGINRLFGKAHGLLSRNYQADGVPVQNGLCFQRLLRRGEGLNNYTVVGCWLARKTVFWEVEDFHSAT